MAAVGPGESGLGSILPRVCVSLGLHCMMGCLSMNLQV